METVTSEYELSHGCKPRGAGNWALEVLGIDGAGAYTTETYFINAKLGDAKREAVRRLKAECGRVKSVVEVKVLP